MSAEAALAAPSQRLVVDDDIQQRDVNVHATHPAVVFDETEITKFVRKRLSVRARVRRTRKSELKSFSLKHSSRT